MSAPERVERAAAHTPRPPAPRFRTLPPKRLDGGPVLFALGVMGLVALAAQAIGWGIALAVWTWL